MHSGISWVMDWTSLSGKSTSQRSIAIVNARLYESGVARERGSLLKCAALYSRISFVSRISLRTEFL